MQVLDIEQRLGRTLMYGTSAFRPLRTSHHAGEGCRVEGLVYQVTDGRWRRFTVGNRDLTPGPHPNLDAARESLTWMSVNETIGRRLRRGDPVVREEHDVVCLADDGVDDQPDGVVVATRGNSSEAKIAWLVQRRPRLRRKKGRKPT